MKPMSHITLQRLIKLLQILSVNVHLKPRTLISLRTFRKNSTIHLEEPLPKFFGNLKQFIVFETSQFSNNKFRDQSLNHSVII